MKLLAIDIGNTNINLGVFKANRLLSRQAIPTRAKDYFPYLKRIIRRQAIDDAIISSVVPAATLRITRDLKRLLSAHPYIIGKEIRVPLKNLYRRPGQVGRDRLVNAYAGSRLYGRPLIVVDCGTAVTFDLISARQEYLGGMILPGLRISLEALAEKTALLPKVSLKSPAGFIGRDTAGSMRNGIIFGFAALIDGLSAKLKRKIGGSARVIGTGGDIALIAGHCQNLDKIDRDLTLKGLNMLYRDFKA